MEQNTTNEGQEPTKTAVQEPATQEPAATGAAAQGRTAQLPRNPAAPAPSEQEGHPAQEPRRRNAWKVAVTAMLVATTVFSAAAFGLSAMTASKLSGIAGRTQAAQRVEAGRQGDSEEAPARPDTREGRRADDASGAGLGDAESAGRGGRKGADRAQGDVQDTETDKDAASADKDASKETQKDASKDAQKDDAATEKSAA